MKWVFQLLFDQMKSELEKQTETLTESITATIMEKIDEKLQPIISDSKKLQIKVGKLEEEIEYLKREKKNNNIVIFGMKEGETSTTQLLDKVKNTFKEDLGINIENGEINNAFRLGKVIRDNKPRPILLSFVSTWKKSDIMKNKKNLKEIYVKDDFSKEVLERRKELLPKVEEERKKGNIAYLKHDKLIVIETNTNEKRKRQPSSSPQVRKQPALSSKDNRMNAFDIMRNRSNSLSNNTASGSKEQ
ncbi:uncharacterized protein LOC134652271 [Cydia amplana]|uniref:uncharacterized protein LOC134652271 n=1 Tax=Cydia amplana TaxID=1869771 RepID=UPI002FE659F8